MLKIGIILLISLDGKVDIIFINFLLKLKYIYLYRWLSEKLDGLRAYWDGTKLYSKHGKQFNPPNSFVLSMPTIPLDGELWMGRGTFEKLTSSTIKFKDSDWKHVKYYVFDLPNSTDTYEDRMAKLKEVHLPEHVQIVVSQLCTDSEQLQNYLNSILENGGEGIVAHKPGILLIS
jgi:DNA ligase-1